MVLAAELVSPLNRPISLAQNVLTSRNTANVTCNLSATHAVRKMCFAFGSTFMFLCSVCREVDDLTYVLLFIDS